MTEQVPVLVPRETVNDDSVRLVALHVEDGAAVAEGQPICEIETSKAAVEIEAPQAGFVRFAAAVGDEVPVGAPLAFVGATPDFIPQASPAVQASALGSPRASGPAEATIAADPVASPDPGAPVRFTPLAKRLADEARLTAGDFAGLRLVRSADVKARITGTPASVRAPSDVVSVGAELPVQVSQGVGVRWEANSRRKQVEIRQISAGMACVLASSVTVSIPTLGPQPVRHATSPADPSTSVVILFEVARLLRKYPIFNAIYDRGRVGFYEAVNIGWAMDDGSGLVVPVIRDADAKDLGQLAEASTDVIQRYVSGRLVPADFLGNTFTVSDLSSAGVFSFAPLITQGTSAILGIGGEYTVPGSDVGMFTVTLAFDHRLADGRTAALFLADLARRVAAHEALRRRPGSVDGQVARCAFCYRDAAVLAELHAYLLRSEVPKGLICSICLREY